ncbi:10217_t:CDS:2 [Funneliformis caledonium]|uniref:10217_t:CDS:1 n=1 Tax=Funneliformis caledonium TaxID=1117310 RepID=A0A9N9BY36_9GLOM|nr:10217_t:CDS:2 [Funneliformis caledonium]
MTSFIVLKGLQRFESTSYRINKVLSFCCPTNFYFNTKERTQLLVE